jgi:hypothetical protein
MRGGVFAVVMQYGRNRDSSLKYMYGIAAIPALGTVLRGSYNTFLEQGCRLQLINPTGQPTGALVSMVRFDGSAPLAGRQLNVPAHGMTDFDLCGNDITDVYGVVTVQPDTANSLAATVIRVGNMDDYRFPTPVRQ